MHFIGMLASSLPIPLGYDPLITAASLVEMGSGNEDSVIVSAMIALAKALGLEVVAEGVETAEQQDFLTGLGCETLQGFLLDRPMTPEQILKRTVDKQSGMPASDRQWASELS